MMATNVQHGFGRPRAVRGGLEMFCEELQRIIIAVVVPRLDGMAESQVVQELAFSGNRVSEGFRIRATRWSEFLAQIPSRDQFRFGGRS